MIDGNAAKCSLEINDNEAPMIDILIKPIGKSICYAGTSFFLVITLVTLQEIMHPLFSPIAQSSNALIEYLTSPKCFGWDFKTVGMDFTITLSFLGLYFPFERENQL